MIAGERVSVGSLTEPPIRYFKQSLLLSVLLHGLIAVFFVSRENLGNSVRLIPAQTVHVYFQQARPAATQSQAQKNQALDAETVPLVSTSRQKQSVPKAVPKIKPLSVPRAVISPASPKGLPTDAKVSAIDQFLDSAALKCNPVEKQSEIRNCDEAGLQPSSRATPRPFERDLAVLFKPPPVAVAAKFKRDMARAEKLASELKYLEAMIDSSGRRSEFLLEQQRQLQKEIQRIDSQYKEVNLLKVLGSGIKTLNKGYEAIREKK